MRLRLAAVRLAALRGAARALTEEPPDPCGIRDDLPLAFWDALRHGLAKDPADRPPTATAYALMIRVSAKTS